jgi:hypothetical protein
MRFPTLDDGASLPELLTSYDYTGEYKEHLIFKRKKNTNYSFYDNKKLLGNFIHSFGEKVDISQFNQALFIEFNIDKSTFGNIINFLYKISPIFINIELENGFIYTYRINPSQAKTGFILSPLITKNEDLKNLILYQNDFNNQYKVKCFTVTLVIEQMKSFYLSNFVDYLYNQNYTLNIYSLY